MTGTRLSCRLDLQQSLKKMAWPTAKLKEEASERAEEDLLQPSRLLLSSRRLAVSEPVGAAPLVENITLRC